HTIAVLPDCKDGSWLVADPWCNPPKWGRVPEANLKKGAEEWGRRVYQTAGGPEPTDARYLDLMQAAVRALMSRARPGREDDNGDTGGPTSDTGGPIPILYTVTAAHAPTGGSTVAVELPILDPTPKLVDIAEGVQVLDLDGSARLKMPQNRT